MDLARTIQSSRKGGCDVDAASRGITGGGSGKPGPKRHMRAPGVVMVVSATNSRFDEPPPVSNTSNNPCKILAHCIEGGPTHWRSLACTLPLTGIRNVLARAGFKEIHFLSQARQHAR